MARRSVKRAVAMILAGGPGDPLSILGQERTIPAVPFGGKYRVIDFVLSNCVNSGIYTVGVLTQYRPRSLNDHIGIGRPWDLDRAQGGVKLLQPFVGRGATGWYASTGDAVFKNLYFIEDGRADVVVILMGDHVYKMDYTEIIGFHQEHGAGATLAAIDVSPAEVHRFGVLGLDDDGRVTDFWEKPAVPYSTLASMGVYVFDRQLLIRRLREAAAEDQHDFGRHILPRMVKLDRVYAYRFHGYWQDVGTIQSYWEANMDLLRDPPALDLYDKDWRIHTRSEERAPALLGEQAVVARSLVCHGCIIEGRVEHSVLSPGVRVAAGAVVRDSIVMTDARIEEGAVVERSILDKEVVVGRRGQVGWGDDYRANEREPERLQTGITIVGKRARVPAGVRIGRNCKIGTGVEEGDYPGELVGSGATVEHTPR